MTFKQNIIPLGGNGPPCPSLEKHLSLGNEGAMAQRENG